MTTTKRTTAETICAHILLGHHDKHLGDLLTAVWGRVGMVADDASAGVRWRLNVPDANLDITSDDLTLREVELLEQYTGVGLVALEGMFAPGRLSTRVVAALIRSCLIVRHGITEAQANEVIAGLPVSGLTDWVSWYSVGDDPKDSSGDDSIPTT